MKQYSESDQAAPRKDTYTSGLSKFDLNSSQILVPSSQAPPKDRRVSMRGCRQNTFEMNPDVYD